MTSNLIDIDLLNSTIFNKEIQHESTNNTCNLFIIELHVYYMQGDILQVYDKP